MASVVEADTALWLRNKLANEDYWSSSGLTSLLTSEVLRKAFICFRDLDHRVRLKLLLSFIEIRRRDLVSLSEDLSMVISLGLEDEDDWVRMIACILKEYSQSSTFCTDFQNESETLRQLIKELDIKVHDLSKTWNLLPHECSYLNKTSMATAFGSQPPPSKNFTLRRKPKSAALRAQLTQRATEAASHKKMAAHLMQSPQNSPVKKINNLVKDDFKQPHMPNKSSMAVPIRHHSRPTLRGIALPKKTKLLDITEQPIGGTGREARKRRKQQELESNSEDTKQKKTGEHQRQQKQQKPNDNTPKSNKEADSEEAKIVDEQMELRNSNSEAVNQETKPSYAVIPGAGTTSSFVPASKHPLVPDNDQIVSVNPNASLGTQEIQRELQVRIRQEQVLRQQQQQMLNDFRILPQQHRNVDEHSNASQISNQSQTSNIPRDIKDQPRPVNEQSLRAAQQMKRGLSLTREQMFAAQEMFKSANKVTRAEKALILGFMAGARDNPFPQQGPILTIKLSEDTETAKHVDGNAQRTLIEMLFEMNYETGHWRRLKRTRVLAPIQSGDSV